MVEFRGCITGAAEKRFLERSRDLAQNIFLLAALILFPMVAFVGISTGVWQAVCAYCSLFVIIPLLARIPKSKRERMAMLPQRIYVEENHIVCVTGQGTEARSVDDVKKVIDHGEFYELSFRFGKVSEKFICQKSLLTQGTLEEFEELFGEKILGWTND